MPNALSHSMAKRLLDVSVFWSAPASALRLLPGQSSLSPFAPAPTSLLEIRQRPLIPITIPRPCFSGFNLDGPYS